MMNEMNVNLIKIFILIVTLHFLINTFLNGNCASQLSSDKAPSINDNYARQLSNHIRIRGPRLKNGWDLTAASLYRNRIKVLSDHARASKDAVIEVATYPLQNVTYSGKDRVGFLKQLLGIGDWEPDTFKIFLRHLPMCTHYIDFGTWIGPTLFFATQLVSFSLGIEADPVAFADVSFNLALNRNKKWSEHTHLLASAIGSGTDANLTPKAFMMQSADPGNSCSGVAGIGKWNYCGDPNRKINWTVNSYTLPAIMQAYDIPSNRNTFVKVDVESFECELIPSWEHWLTGLKNDKPTLFISLHPQITSCTREQFESIERIARLFKYVTDPFDISTLSKTSIIVFSDN